MFIANGAEEEAAAGMEDLGGKTSTKRATARV